MEIDRRSTLAGLAALVTAPALSRQAVRRPDWFDRGIIVDGLGGLFDPYAASCQTRLSDRAWEEVRRTGVTAINQTLMPVGNVADPWADFQRSCDEWDARFGANPDRLVKVGSAADIRQSKAGGRLGIIMGTQDTAMIGEQLDRIAETKKRGVRVVQLTYNLNNLSGDGALEPRGAGLSRLGRQTLARIEEERLLLDLSHGGVRTIDEAIAAAKRPLAITHSGARALHDHPRNVSDAAMKAVADKGGVIGIYFMPFLVPSGKPVTADLVRHIDHAARVVGEDHLALGSDNGLLPRVLDEAARERQKQWQLERIRLGIASPGEAVGVMPWIEELNRIDAFRLVGAALARSGWTERRLEKLFGGNWLRLFGDVWGG